MLAALSAKDAAQNAYMVSCLLARHGFVYLEAPFIVQLLPAMLVAAHGAVFNGVPPYDLWEHPPVLGKIPPAPQRRWFLSCRRSLWCSIRYLDGPSA